MKSSISKMRVLIFLPVLSFAIQNGIINLSSPENHSRNMPDLIGSSASSLNNTESIEMCLCTNKAKSTAKTEVHINSPFIMPPMPSGSFKKIDRHARRCPDKWENSIEDLASYLLKRTKSDIDKARAIYVWLTENIVYDDYTYNTNNFGDNSANGVLKSRKAVCDGFSNLFLALGKEMGLEIVKASGYSKGIGYRDALKLLRENHSWNLIKIDGTWRLFDATWGQGYGEIINGSFASTKKFDDSWFNVDPYNAIFTHFPKNKDYMHIDPIINFNLFKLLPVVTRQYFKLGFSGKESLKDIIKNTALEFPKLYDINTHIEVIEAPKYKTLLIGTSYFFELHIPNGIRVAIIDSNGEWTYFEHKTGKLFSLNYTPTTKGELELYVNYSINSDQFKAFISYEVKEM